MITEGKGPKDGRVRPVFVLVNNKIKLAVSDGKGNCYECFGDLYGSDEKYITPENLLDPSTYEYERGLTGFDF
jgi:hypothetical protein